MTLSDQIANDSAAVFLQTGHFAESVTYVPNIYDVGDTRTNRAIQAVVIRNQFSVFENDVESIAPVFEVYVENDTTRGINSDELDLGGDQISLPVRPGKAAEARTVTRLIEQDAAMLVLEVR